MTERIYFFRDRSEFDYEYRISPLDGNVLNRFTSRVAATSYSQSPQEPRGSQLPYGKQDPHYARVTPACIPVNRDSDDAASSITAREGPYEGAERAQVVVMLGDQNLTQKRQSGQ